MRRHGTPQPFEDKVAIFTVSKTPGRMFTTVATLLDRLDSEDIMTSGVIAWGSPVPWFGNVATSRVATVGLNPSNREFVDQDGNELIGQARRFQTLRSLSIPSWADADSTHLQRVIESCLNYFNGNPYDLWFKKLDQIVAGASASYYSVENSACHLDLIPYATDMKWTALKVNQRDNLLRASGNFLGRLLGESVIDILILNGQTVVNEFQTTAGVLLDRQEMPEWSLPRASGQNVSGYAYSGSVYMIAGVPLERELRILGYNHNIQSSFGVTKVVIEEIRDWVTRSSRGNCQ
jgi:hypothetical protein